MLICLFATKIYVEVSVENKNLNYTKPVFDVETAKVMPINCFNI